MIRTLFAEFFLISFLYAVTAGAQTITVIKIEGLFVYLRCGAKMSVEKDAYYKTYKEVNVVLDRKDGTFQNELVETGILKIITVTDDFSKAKILTNNGIALGNVAIASTYKTKIGVTAGYSMFSIAGKVNKAPSPISGSVTPDFSGFDLPLFMYGAFIGVDFYKIQDLKIGAKFLFNLFPSCGDLQGFAMDLSVYRKFMLSDPRFMIPAGIGVTMSRIRYHYDYSSYFVNEPDDHLQQYFGGAFAYTGLDFSISTLFHTFITVGFRYQDANKEWSVRYKTGGKNDVFGYNSKDKYEIPSAYQAVNDVKIIGLDLKAGIMLVF